MTDKSVHILDILKIFLMYFIWHYYYSIFTVMFIITNN